eukprot:483929-Amphidinium_carterae.1
MLSSVWREEKSPEISVNRGRIVNGLFDGVVLYLKEWHEPVYAGRQADHVRFAGPTKVDGMHHEGAIPESASRMTMADNVVSLGHGLKGLLPSIPGTLSALSLSENKLEGHLPELHITANSTLLVHANCFSCHLPRHQEVTPKASLALIGNHFTKPRHLPAWIRTTERPSDMFCVSNGQGKSFIMLLSCGAGSCFLLSTVLQLARKTLPMYRKFARARSA